KVAKLSEEPEQYLIPPSGEVNVDDTTDKSLYRASVQPVTHSKATTDLNTKKKKIPPYSKPKSPYKSLVDFELVEEQGNQPSAAEAEKVLGQNVEVEKDVKFVAMEEVVEEQSLEIPTVDQLLDQADKLNKAI
ncbi:hypothetical protein Tco_1325144, partial [Tanacetum coccineum]